MSNTTRQSIGWRALSTLASLRITVVGLSLLLLLTIWGTIYQVDNGLYQAQQKFFRSLFFIGDINFHILSLPVHLKIPFVGAQLVMGVVLVNLIAACVKLALQGRMMLGILLTHGGLILMLGAGAVTFYMGVESHLTLLEGEASNVSSSSGQWELTVFRPETNSAARDITAIDLPELKEKATLKVPGTDFEIVVDANFPHSQPSAETAGQTGETYWNGSNIKHLDPLPACKDPGDDRPGLLLQILASGKRAGRCLLWGGDSNGTTFRIGEKQYVLELRRIRYLLPATIELVDFKREMHPGIDMARSFSSKVIVRQADGQERNVTISMNKPLRLQNFTFYQSSYNILPDGREASTFSVVKNYGRTMPYIATIATFLGMVLHFVGRLLHRVRHLRHMEAAR